MLTQKALTKKLTATYCSTTNNLFVHKNNIAAHNVYSNNSNKINEFVHSKWKRSDSRS